MRILLLNYEYPPLGGGTGQAMRYLLKEFAKNKEVRIDVVASSPAEFRMEIFAENITLHLLDIGKKHGNLQHQSLMNILRYTWKSYFYCKKLLHGNRFDLCHAFFGIPCGYIAMRLGVPYIVSLRGSDVPFHNKRFWLLDRFFLRWLSKKIWRKARAVIAVSRYLETRAKISSPHQGFSVIPNGVDTEEFTSSAQRNPGEFHILFAGRLSKIKGLHYLAEALIILRRDVKDVHLHLVGDGPLKVPLMHFMKREGLQDVLHLHGMMPHARMQDFYHRADVFVLPSLHEGMPNAILEAMACGLPIITTKTGAAELLDGNGLVVEKNSSLAIATALVEIARNQSLKEKMGKRSRELAEQMRWDHISKQYLRLYSGNEKKE